jgi:hypothetical protein
MATMAGLAAEPLHQPVDGGHTDWTRGVLVVRATSSGGAGLLTSWRTLEQEAWLRLESLLAARASEIQLTSDVVAGDLMAGGDPLALRLNEGLQGWRVTTTRYRRSGQVEMEAELVLGDWLRPALLAWATHTPPEQAQDGFTGLLVDTRGLDVRPAVVPRLLSPDLAVMFGPEHLTAHGIGLRPAVVWVTDPADVQAAAHAGPNPLVVGATAVRQGSDLVLDPRDSASLIDMGPLLARGRIVVVVDP